MHKPYNDSMSATVVAACDCSESLLSGCVPLQLPLSKHVFIIPPIISNLLRPSIQLLCASDCSKDSSSDCTIVTIYTTYRKQWSPCELLKGIPWSIVQSKRKMAKILTICNLIVFPSSSTVRIFCPHTNQEKISDCQDIQQHLEVMMMNCSQGFVWFARGGPEQCPNSTTQQRLIQLKTKHVHAHN